MLTRALQIDDESLLMLSKIGSQTTLRYAVQLLTPAFELAKTNGRAGVTRDEIEEVRELFYDAKTSAKILRDHGDKFLQ
jgi:RuvB-like protein 1